MNDFFYKKLDAYKLAKEMTITIYNIVRSFPENERYVLGDQIRRAAVSIPSNIAEGMGRFSIKERIHFLDIAYGSLTEVTCQIDIANALGYVNQQTLDDVNKLASRISMTLYGLKKTLKEKKILTNE